MSSVKTKIYVPEPAKGLPIVKLVETYFGLSSRADTLFSSILPPDFSYTAFEFTDSPSEADFALSPHPVRRNGDEAHTFAQVLLKRMKEIGKQTAVFIGGDLSFKVKLETDFVVLIGSQYLSNMGNNEIIVPPFVEDPFSTETIAPCERGVRPRIGFCGWASFPNFKSKVVAHIKKIGWYALAIITNKQYVRARQRGLLYRIAGLKALRADTRIDSDFIVRSSFSGNTSTISVNPEKARQEFVQNMISNQFAFAPKGDGNFSVRLYEALSFGRIPVMIDTDCMLPLEHSIPYDRIIVRVPHTQVQQVGDYVVQAFESLDSEQMLLAQQEARSVFRSTLRYDAFFNELFSRPLNETLQASRAFYARRSNTIE